MRSATQATAHFGSIAAFQTGDIGQYNCRIFERHSVQSIGHNKKVLSVPVAHGRRGGYTTHARPLFMPEGRGQSGNRRSTMKQHTNKLCSEIFNLKANYLSNLVLWPLCSFANKSAALQ